MPAKPKPRSKSQANTPSAQQTNTVYRFLIRLIGGPFSLARGQRKPVRVIDMRGDQSLDDLHEAIFDAFDREEMHLYEFQIGGRKPMDRAAICYAMPGQCEGGEKNARRAKIEALGLVIGQTFFYWFDFGDDWMHEIRLDAVLPAEPGARYPVLVKKQGESPPQYPDWDEDDEEEDDEDDEDGEDDPRELLALEDIGNHARVREAILGDLRSARRRPRNDADRLADIFVAVAAFCAAHLDADYINVCFKLLLHTDQDTGLSLERGEVAGWAAGLAHAAGFVNLLDDPAREPHMKLADIAEHFGVSQATMTNRSRDIRKALDIGPLSPAFCTLATLADNPLVWMRPNVDGIIVDVRLAPREAQEAAFRAGLIPWIPADHPELHAKRAKPAPSPKTPKTSAGKTGRSGGKAPAQEPPKDGMRQGSLFDVLPGGKDEA